MSRIGENYRANKNRTLLAVRYASPKVKIEEEYTLMGVNAIISATGGSLGLFLGLSCYGVAWKILEYLESVGKYIMSPWVKAKVEDRKGKKTISSHIV